MTKQQALDIIDAHKNRLVDPVQLLNWTWLRVIILNIPDEDWDKAVLGAAETLGK